MARGKKARVTLTVKTEEAIRGMEHVAAQRMWQATQIVRNKVLETLSGERSGRRYRVPGTNVYYTASAPGEPPAVRTGNLRKSIKTEIASEGRVIKGRVGTDLDYGRKLEYGTRHMAPRPWLERSFKEAEEDVKDVLGGRWF